MAIHTVCVCVCDIVWSGILDGIVYNNNLTGVKGLAPD